MTNPKPTYTAVARLITTALHRHGSLTPGQLARAVGPCPGGLLRGGVIKAQRVGWVVQHGGRLHLTDRGRDALRESARKARARAGT